MSPEMLTLVAAVLVYDRAEDCVVERPGRVGRCESRKAISDTKLEKDMVEDWRYRSLTVDPVFINS